MYKKLLLLFVFLSSALPLEAQRGTTSSKRSIRRQLEQQMQKNKAAEKMLSTQVSKPVPPEKKPIKKEKPFWTRERIIQAGVGAAGLVLLMGGGAYWYKQHNLKKFRKKNTPREEKSLTIGDYPSEPSQKEIDQENEKRLIKTITNLVMDSQGVSQSERGDVESKIHKAVKKELNTDDFKSLSLGEKAESIKKRLFPKGLEGKQEE